MNVLAQVRVWNLDPAEGVAASSCVDDGSVVLGVLGGSVVSVARSGRLRIFDPVHGDQTETVFEAPAGHLDTAVCVLLQKRQKVLLVSEDGSLHQVRNPPCSARLRNTRDPQPAVPLCASRGQRSTFSSCAQVSRTGNRTQVFSFPEPPSLLSATEDENTLIAGAAVAQPRLSHDPPASRPVSPAPTGRHRTLTLLSIRHDHVDPFLVLRHDDAVVSCCVSSDSRLIVSGAADHLIRVITTRWRRRPRDPSWFWVLLSADPCSVAQVWSWTSGALLDTLCSEVPVTRLVLAKDFLLSASAASSCVHLWSLRYDARHKPAAHVPSGSAHVAITKDADQIFYVRHRNQTEVFSWNNHKGASLWPLCPPWKVLGPP